MRLATVLLTGALSLSLSGCWFGKKTPAVIPPPPSPRQPTAGPAEVKPQQPTLPEEQPAPLPAQPEIKEPAPVAVPAPQKAPPPRPAAKKRTSPAPAPPQLPQPAEQPQSQPSAAPPQLGEILSDRERRQHEAEYAQSLARARSALRQASGKSLNRTQKETVERIGTFIQQAE